MKTCWDACKILHTTQRGDANGTKIPKAKKARRKSSQKGRKKGVQRSQKDEQKKAGKGIRNKMRASGMESREETRKESEALRKEKAKALLRKLQFNLISGFNILQEAYLISSKTYQKRDKNEPNKTNKIHTS